MSYDDTPLRMWDWRRLAHCSVPSRTLDAGFVVDAVVDVVVVVVVAAAVVVAAVVFAVDFVAVAAFVVVADAAA